VKPSTSLGACTRESERAKARAGSRPRLDSAVCACGADFPGLAGRAGPCGPAARQARTVPRTVLVRARLLGLVARRVTRCAACGRSARTHAASQKWRRAARAATSPAVLGLAGRAGPEARPLARRGQSPGLSSSGLAAPYARGRLPARSFAAPAVHSQAREHPRGRSIGLQQRWRIAARADGGVANGVNENLAERSWPPRRRPRAPHCSASTLAREHRRTAAQGRSRSLAAGRFVPRGLRLSLWST
jgi:hypothetical protein